MNVKLPQTSWPCVQVTKALQKRTAQRAAGVISFIFWFKSHLAFIWTFFASKSLEHVETFLVSAEFECQFRVAGGLAASQDQHALRDVTRPKNGVFLLVLTKWSEGSSTLDIENKWVNHVCNHNICRICCNSEWECTWVEQVRFEVYMFFQHLSASNFNLINFDGKIHWFTADCFEVLGDALGLKLRPASILFTQLLPISKVLSFWDVFLDLFRAKTWMLDADFLSPLLRSFIAR